MTAGLLLLISCNPGTKPGPIELPENRFSPTPIIVPTCTPTEGPVPMTTPGPDPTQEVTVMPTVEVMPSPTVIPEPTELPQVTELPEPTAIPSPEATPTPQPNEEPVTTPSPEPTATVSPTATPTPVPEITPTLAPEELVNKGWQKTRSIDESYTIIFPELFRDSYVQKTDRELITGYTCIENENIEFTISYKMQQTMVAILEELIASGGVVTEELPEEGRIAYWLKSEGLIYHGVLLDVNFSSALLGDTFGEEEFIPGVMQAVFSYPEEEAEEYEKEPYQYYIIKNREEE